jgi:hypothetical protein
VIVLPPQLDVEPAEELYGLVIPHPPHVAGDLFERFQFFRKIGYYPDILDYAHQYLL